MGNGPYRTIEHITREAESELAEEMIGDAKRRLKAKLREIKQAERVLANLRRDLLDLQAQILEENQT